MTNSETLNLEMRVFGECPFWVLRLPTGGLRRRLALERGVRELKKRRVRRCVFPKDFVQQSIFAAHGMKAVDVLPLLRKKAGEWTLVERQARGLTGSVGVAADRLTEDVTAAVRLLIDRLGSVSLLQIGGAEELQRTLRRESGAVLRLLSPAQLCTAETLLDFSDGSEKGQTLTLRFAEGELPRFLLPEKLRCAFPADVNEAQLAAALWELGKLEEKKIGLKSRM